MSEQLQELLKFLDDSSRFDIQLVALEQVMGLTGSKDGLALLKSDLNKVIKTLCKLLVGKADILSKDAGKALVNITSNAALAVDCLESDVLVDALWTKIADENSVVADPACMALCNLTIDAKCCDKVLKALNKAGISLETIVGIFCMSKHNLKGHNLHYLGPFLSNLSQLPDTRSQLLDRDAVTISRLLAFTDYKDSHIRRGGVIGTLRNCCFDPAHHQWLLDESQVDILPKLLLPLAGPTPDSFDAEDIDKLPMDLQYLDEDQQVEPDPDLRKMILEALYQLCATRKCRDLHKSEKEESMQDTIEDVVQLLIKKEDEINIDSYHDVQVPNDVAAQIEAEKHESKND